MIYHLLKIGCTMRMVLLKNSYPSSELKCCRGNLEEIVLPLVRKK